MQEGEDNLLNTPTISGAHRYLGSSDPGPDDMDSSSGGGGGGGGGEGRGESMDTQLSSELEPHSSDLERIESNASSLSLSSERLDEGLLGIMSLSRTRQRTVSLRPVILDGMESSQERSESVSSWPLLALDETANRTHLSSSLEFGSGTPPRGESGGAGSRTRLQLSLTHDSSLDQESSQLSQDSSNGSASHIDQLNEEDEALLSFTSDSGMRYRTDSDDPSTLISTATGPATSTTTVAGTSLAAATTTATGTGAAGSPLAVAGRVSGESVIVGGRPEVSGREPPQRISDSQEGSITEQASVEGKGEGCANRTNRMEMGRGRGERKRKRKILVCVCVCV